jgi:hypothetical protein
VLASIKSKHSAAEVALPLPAIEQVRLDCIVRASHGVEPYHEAFLQETLMAFETLPLPSTEYVAGTCHRLLPKSIFSCQQENYWLLCLRLSHALPRDSDFSASPSLPP